MENDNSENHFFDFIKCLSKINEKMYEKLLAQKQTISFIVNITNKIILSQYNKEEAKNKFISFITKKIKNFSRFMKIKNFRTKYKSNLIEKSELIMLYYIGFNYNILKNVLIYKETKPKTNDILIIYDTFILFLNFFGNFFMNNIINHEYFETFLKLLIIMSISKSQDKEPNLQDEIVNFIFLKGCIYLIKNVFKNILLINGKFSKEQEELFSNIIDFIHNKILYHENDKNTNAYLNKVLLYQNDYKTLNLLDLKFIYSNLESQLIQKKFIYFLTTIYSFSLKYENLFSPLVQQLSSLFANFKTKTLNQINDDIKLSDFPLTLLSSMNEREKQFLEQKSCFLKQGFYFGRRNSGLNIEINSIESEFSIIFGFRLEISGIEEIALLEFINNKDKANRIKFFFKQTNDINTYYIYLDEKKEYNLGIKVEPYKNYIIAINFKTATLLQSSSIRISYIKDDVSFKENEYKVTPLHGKEVSKLKNLKNENFTLLFGREFDDIELDNSFVGCISDIMILNTKNLKNNDNDRAFIESILGLRNEYRELFTIFGENLDEYKFLKNKNTNANYIQFSETIKFFAENEQKLFELIKIIIGPNIFKFIKYRDEIDYLNIFNLIEEKPISVKKKYLDFKLKPELSEDEKNITLFYSSFDKKFHCFQNNMTKTEFIKIGGINLLSLILEYYYQILEHFNEIKNTIDENELKKLLDIISKKILNCINFFDKYITWNMEIIRNYDDISKLFYQLANTLLKFMEHSILDFHIIKALVGLIINPQFKGENDGSEKISQVKVNLFDFLLNPKIYQKSDKLFLEKINYVMENFILKIKLNLSYPQLQFMKLLNTKKILKSLLQYIWLFDYNNSVELNNNNKNENEIIEPQNTNNERLIKNIIDNYSEILIEFLKLSKTIPPEKKTPKNDNKDSKSEKSGNLSILLRLGRKKVKEQKEEGGMPILDYFFERAMENRSNTHIFSRMITIVFKTNLIDKFDKNKIKKLMSIIFRELEAQGNKNDEYKKLMYFSSIQILIAYHFIKSPETKNNKESNLEQEFHAFLRSLNINLDFFYALISSLKDIKSILNSISQAYEIKTEEINDNNKEKESGNFTNCPLSIIKLDTLEHYEIKIIISILEDIVFLLYKIAFNNKKNEIEKGKENLEENEDIDIEKKIYEVIKKNLDIVFKSLNTKIGIEIFSSANDICAELLYLKWILSQGEKKADNNYIENVITKYHKELLKSHNNPFIFKFYQFLCHEKTLPYQPDTVIEPEIIHNLKISLLNFIISTLTSFFKDINYQNPQYIHFVSNTLNLIIILNDELNNNSDIFELEAFYTFFNKLICLLDKSCLLYSNYYIESEESHGKIISEIIYDIFFNIPANFFNQKDFIKAFIKENKSEKAVYDIFYLIDLLKENIIDKEPKTKEQLKKYIPSFETLRIIHKTMFKKKNKMKLFLSKRLYPIEDINFCIYILAKSFIYLKKKELHKKLSDFLMNKFLPLISQNLFRLYTKRSNFYGNQICPKFPLYSFTKTYFETYIIQNPNNFASYDDFFKNDQPVNLKEEYNLSYCYSSRLVHNIKRSSDINKSLIVKPINMNVIENSQLIINYEDKGKEEEEDNNNKRANSINVGNIGLNKISNNNSMNSEDQDLSRSLDNSKNSNDKDDEYFCYFEKIKKKNMIFYPKNYFFKIVFSKILKNILFYDKSFQNVKKAYILFMRKKEAQFNKDTKQLNFPSTQKNFSNTTEPRIFLRKDFEFFDDIFFPISNSYIKNLEFVKRNVEKYIFYPHRFKLKDQKKEINFIFCEYVTPQSTHFGKVYLFKKFFFFESQKDDPRDFHEISDNQVNAIFNYGISSKIDDKHYIYKHKNIVIFLDDIKEIIPRRTLLLNQSLEVFHKNGKSFFFNFFTEENYNQFHAFYNNIDIKDDTKIMKKKIDVLLYNFKKGKISTYEYLLGLNKYGTRTYSDLTQYPVFPWLIVKYSNITNILSGHVNSANSGLRDLNYPMSVQTDAKREVAMSKYKSEGKFKYHHGTHYSTTAYIYFYLLRINPYNRNMIKLQDDKYDDPNRVFLSFKDTEKILDENDDNRELIPDFFCYVDFYCNFNCSFFKFRQDGGIIDDFVMSATGLPSYYFNTVSNYVTSLFNNKSLLNSVNISQEIHKWVDIIFGKKQYPKEKESSCNIYQKLSYEQNINMEKKLKKYYKLFKENKITAKTFLDKVRSKADLMINFGVNPKIIINDNVQQELKQKGTELVSKSNKTVDEVYYYFNRICNDQFILLKEDKKSKGRNKTVIIYGNKTFKEKVNNMYICKSMYTIPTETSIPLYRDNYSFSYILLNCEKTQIKIILSCRYLENYFKIQYSDRTLNIFYEDFVTTIVAKKQEANEVAKFYTGLYNGKLTEWELVPYIDNNKDKKKKSKTLFDFRIHEVKNVYAHDSPITAIEIYMNLEVIITAGEDKFIYIRKLFDFELLSSIDLTYSFGNDIISKTPNIFPCFIKASELNLLYVILYDYDSNYSFIRGYNFNGLYFAQTDPNLFNFRKDYCQFNNISLTKSGNLIVGFYNFNSIYILSGSKLNVLWTKDIIKDPKMYNKGTRMVEYNSNYGEFYILYDNNFQIMTLNDKNEQKELESF